MEINKLLTTYNYTKGTADRIKYIVIHYVGATGGAKANCEYYASKYVGASAHYYVDFDGAIWQSVEDKNIAWHCGAKSYVHSECRNANSVGIELCVRNTGDKSPSSKDWYFEDATVTAAIELTKYLMEKYGISADHVIRHYDVTGKICPNPYVLNNTNHTWDDFKAAISSGVGSWEQDGEHWKYKKPDGTYLQDAWEVINHHWYCFGVSGYMLTGWQNIGGEWYYLDDTTGGDLEGALWHEASNHSGAMEVWYVD